MSKISKNEEEPVEIDEKTAKHLHKLAENAKERGLPDCFAAHFEHKAWEATNSEEKFKSCEKCGMPPPPPLISVEEKPSEKCRQCGEINKKLIGTEAEILKNEVIQKKNRVKNGEKREKSLKRPAEKMTTPKEVPRKVCRVPKSIGFVPAPPSDSPKTSPLLLQSKSNAKRQADRNRQKIKVKVEKEPDYLADFMKTT